MIKEILYNCEADSTVLIRKPQVISGGVRTPCTLPLDPPLYVPLYEKRSNKPSSWACTFIGEIEQNTKEEKMIQCSAPYWEIENTIRFRADGLNFFPLVSFCKGFYLQPPNACTTLRFFPPASWGLISVKDQILFTISKSLTRIYLRELTFLPIRRPYRIY